MRQSRQDGSEAREDDGEPTLEGCFAADGTDLTVIHWSLERTPAERLQAAQSLLDLVCAARPLDDDAAD